MPSPTPSVAVVVLNWNAAADTLECLRSLRSSTIPLHVIVVDNASTDGSLKQIAESGLADAIVENSSNLGYAEGNNVGLRLAIAGRFPIVAVLNNDTVIESEAFADLARELPENEHRAVSPDIRYFDEPARSWFIGGVIDRGWPRHLQPHEIDHGSPAGVVRPTECLTGCCIVARRGTWEYVGLFDPRYFLIFEDSDWSLRARRLGVSLAVVTQSRIQHKVSRSFAEGMSSLVSNFYFVRNGLKFEARYARPHLLTFTIRWLVRPSVRLVVRRESLLPMLFRWLGALAFVVRVDGRAPKAVERLADRFTEPSESGTRTQDVAAR